MPRLTFCVLFASVLFATTFSARAADKKAEVAQSILVTFKDEKMTQEQAMGVLKKAGLDPKTYAVVCWDEKARQLTFRGEATDKAVQDASDALKKAGANADAFANKYVPGDVLVCFKPGATRAKASALLANLGLGKAEFSERDAQFEKEYGLTAVIKVKRGNEWPTIDNLVKDPSVKSAGLNGIMEAF